MQENWSSWFTTMSDLSKSTCTITGAGYKLEISDSRRRGSENKGADQLRSYCEADLRLCFCTGKNLVFSRCGSYYLFQEIDGKALLLLNSDMMMKYMGLKLGPVLKLCNLIDKLRARR